MLEYKPEDDAIILHDMIMTFISRLDLRISDGDDGDVTVRILQDRIRESGLSGSACDILYALIALVRGGDIDE